MSHTIICKQCQTANPLGSKFCNKCGSRLPPSTKILCPHCHTPNPSNHLYCDHCGKRLGKEGLPEEPKPEGQKPGREKFSLPARPPGLTAPIGPNNLPDWQGAPTDSIGEEDEENPPPSQEFHSLEDIAPLQKTTDELPTWLVDKLDSSDPGFEPPKEITTDHFLELLQAAENPDKEDLPDSLAQAAAEANLPDWLQDVVPAPEAEEKTSPPTPDSQPGKPPKTNNLPDSWSADLNQEETGSVADWGQPTADPELPDWLTDFTQSEPDTPEREDDEDNELTRSGVFDMSEFGEQVLGGANLPAWMDDNTTPEEPESLPLSNIFQSEEFAQEVRDTLENELPDWLMPASDHTSQEPEATEPASDLLPLNDNFGDWLSELDEEPDEGQLSHMPEADSGWLSELDPAQPVPVANQSAKKKDIAEEDVFSEADLDQPKETESESPDWLNELGPAYTAQLTPSTSDSEEPPDWLAELGPPQTNILPDSANLPDTPEIDAPLSDIFNLDAEEDLIPGWLEEPFSEPKSALESHLLPEEDDDELVKPESFASDSDLQESFTLDETAEPDVPDATLEEEPDWLEELSALGPEAFTTESTLLEEDQDEESVAPKSVASEPPVFSDDEPLSELPAAFTGLFDESLDDGEEVAPEERILSDDSLDFGEVEEGVIPEWLTQLGIPPTDSESGVYESDGASLEEQIFAGELPEWVASMRPESKDHQSSLPGLTVVPLLENNFDDIPENLGGAELPDWLEDAPAALGLGKPATTHDQELAPDIPDWLQFKEGEEAEDVLGSQIEDVTAELSALLAALPPARDPVADLVRADLPEWVKAMKPKDLAAGGSVPEPEQPLQETGPLSGIRGVIEIEPAITRSHASNSTQATFTITAAQEEQAALLRQIQAGLQEHTRTISLGGTTVLSPWLRTVLAILLLVTLFAGLLGPNLQRPAPIPAGVENAFAALEMTAGQSVVVAFEYTPSMAAELTPQARLMIEHLAAQGSNIITVSQYAAGLALANQYTEEYATASLGFIPGEAIGLRELSSCLSAGEACHTLAGHGVDAAVQEQLGDVALIVVLTGERASLINWIEQLGATSDVAIVAATTQALAPVAAPYAATGQLQGIVSGLMDTAVYAQMVNADTSNISQQLNAQHLAQWLAALLLLGGALVALFSRKKQT